jgi:hypothetical protein
MGSADFPDRTLQWNLTKKCEFIAKYWARQWTALQLVILREKGESEFCNFKFNTLKGHQRDYFLAGLDKLGISRKLPPAIIAGQYHYFSNLLGGIRMEYVEESPKKVWIRYHPPAYGFAGSGLFAVPSSAQRAMFSGWHSFNGESLGNPRLGWVLTKLIQDGEPYDEGYYMEFDRDLKANEKIQFAVVATSPEFDPDKAPKLDPALWPQERAAKAQRNYARGYVKRAIVNILAMYGVHSAAYLISHALRVCMIQYFDEFSDEIGVSDTNAKGLVEFVSIIARLAGDRLIINEISSGSYELNYTGVMFGTEDDIPEDIHRSLFALVEMCAKLMGAKILAKYCGLNEDGSQKWIIKDVPNRLF